MEHMNEAFNNLMDEVNKKPTQLDQIQADLAEIKAMLTKKKRVVKPKDEWIQVEFQRFWKVWPKKKAKQDALSAFTALMKKTGQTYGSSTTDSLIANIKFRLKSDFEWIKEAGIFIPLAATYLRGERWEDAITPIPADKTVAPKKEHISATYKQFDPTKRGDADLDESQNPYAEEQ